MRASIDLSGDRHPDRSLEVSAFRRTDKVGPLGFAQNGNARTNDLGEFRMAGLASGVYIIVASVQRGGPFEAVQTGTTTFSPTYFPGTLDQNAARVMTLAPGQTATGVEFAIVTVAAFRVSGIAVDQTGRPSPGAMVMLIPDLRASASFAPTITFRRSTSPSWYVTSIPLALHMKPRMSVNGVFANWKFWSSLS